MSVNAVNPAKALLTALLAAISTRLDAVGDLIWLFIAAVILDYVTGIAAAVYNKELNSGLGLRGIVKKVGEFCIVATALISDEVVALAGKHFDVTISIHGAISAVVLVWLILNELISILENISKMSVALPPFLMTGIKRLKQYTETNEQSKQDKQDNQNIQSKQDEHNKQHVQDDADSGGPQKPS